MRKIIHNLQRSHEDPIDINEVDLSLVLVVACNKYSPNIKGMVLKYTDGLGLTFPYKQALFNSASTIRERDLPSLMNRLKNDYDFYVL